MKNLLNLNDAQKLSKSEQQSIHGGWDSGFCARLLASGNCADYRWEACGLPNDISLCR